MQDMKYHVPTLQEKFSYDAEAGTITWRSNRTKSKIGQSAVSKNPSNGMLRCRFRIGGKFHQLTARRVAWLLAGRAIPDGMVVAVVDGADRDSLKLADLELVIVVKCNVAAHTDSTRHGCTRNGKQSPEYTSWVMLKQRCLNPSATGFPRYGGRGITIHPAWLNSFERFLTDMGPRPTGTSIDRIDVDGNYEPGNCRWATASEQRQNQRRCQKAAA